MTRSQEDPRFLKPKMLGVCGGPQLLQGHAQLAAERTSVQRHLSAAEAALWDARAEGATLR